MRLRLINIISIICCYTIQSTEAQQQEHWYGGLNGGLSFPAGKFARHDSLTNEYGFANVGGIFNIEAGYRLSRSFVITSCLSTGTNSFLDSEYIDLSEEIYLQTYPGANLTFTSGHYKWHNIALGPMICFGPANSFYCRLLLGQLRLFTPLIRTTVNEAGTSYTFSELPTSDYAFSYQAGAGIRIRLNSKLLLNFSSDYLHSKHEFGILTFSADNSNTTKPETLTYFREFTVIQLNAGIIYSFVKTN